ncbi:hypothetical protein D047_4994 [Vibrio parahaemolyticus VPTS-2010_2]|uniref:hypothetical protein n=1 Tax=Vibrio parahaemolyticus TaxID=670 RepID=UPI000451166E|nr:hypothetical protein [Vibrio parahaemolyticus]EXJ40217.1 hypothetical protein D047_4994 [Vibrio parahaemolyticus VPTS-2010_2]
MRKFYMFFLVFSFFLPFKLVAAEALVTRTIEIPPTLATYDDFSLVFNHLEQLISTANKEFKSEQKYDYEEIEIVIESNNEKVSFSDWQELIGLGQSTGNAYKLRYNYSLRNAPVSSVEFYFSDKLREISVAGTDYSQVSAISAMVQDKISPMTTNFSGFGVRMFGGLSFLIGISLISSFATRNNKYSSIVTLAVNVIANVCIWTLPWETWIPGFTIYTDSASFVDRNINMISLIAALATFLLPAIGLAHKQITSKQKTT